MNTIGRFIKLGRLCCLPAFLVLACSPPEEHPAQLRLLPTTGERFFPPEDDYRPVLDLTPVHDPCLRLFDRNRDGIPDALYPLPFLPRHLLKSAESLIECTLEPVPDRQIVECGEEQAVILRVLCDPKLTVADRCGVEMYDPEMLALLMKPEMRRGFPEACKLPMAGSVSLPRSSGN